VPIVDLMTEAQLDAAIKDLATRLGWLTYHTHRSDRSEPGFPDRVFVRGERLIFAELKNEKRLPTNEQTQWLNALCDVAAVAPHVVEVYVWRPRHLNDGSIAKALR